MVTKSYKLLQNKTFCVKKHLIDLVSIWSRLDLCLANVLWSLWPQITMDYTRSLRCFVWVLSLITAHCKVFSLFWGVVLLRTVHLCHSFSKNIQHEEHQPSSLKPLNLFWMSPTLSHCLCYLLYVSLSSVRYCTFLIHIPPLLLFFSFIAIYEKPIYLSHLITKYSQCENVLTVNLELKNRRRLNICSFVYSLGEGLRYDITSFSKVFCNRSKDPSMVFSLALKLKEAEIMLQFFFRKILVIGRLCSIKQLQDNLTDETTMFAVILLDFYFLLLGVFELLILQQLKRNRAENCQKLQINSKCLTVLKQILESLFISEQSGAGTFPEKKILIVLYKTCFVTLRGQGWKEDSLVKILSRASKTV